METSVVTCSFMAGIFNYRLETLDWGAITKKITEEFTEDDLLSLAGTVKALGLDNLELWHVHSSYRTLEEADGQRLARRLAEIGMRVPAYCVGGFTDRDLEVMERAYRYARGLGARVVVGTLDARNPVPVLEKLADLYSRYGIPYAVENHPAPNFGNFDEILAVCAPYGRAVGVNLDTGIAANMGMDVLAEAKKLGPALIHVHAKQARPENPPVDFAALGRYLTETGYTGLISVEHNTVNDPGDVIRATLAAFLEK